MTRAGIATAVAAGLAAMAVAACQALAGIAETHFRAPDAGSSVDPDAARDAGEHLEDASSDVYTCVQLPSAPEGGPGGDADAGSQPMVVVLRDLDLGLVTPEAPPLGVDLDCDHDCKASCVPPRPDVCVRAGLDNSLRRALLRLKGKIPNPDIETRPHVQGGEASLVLKITGYNGQQDDADVGVEVLVSDGLMERAPDGGARLPIWDGSRQEWGLDDRFPSFVATRAYVTSGELIARFDALAIPLAYGSGFAVFDLAETAVRARLRVGEELTGEIVGRLPTAPLLTTIARRHNCNLYEDSELRQQFCAVADMALRASQDRTGAACDALSFAALFVAAPAAIGQLRTTRLPPPSAACIGLEFHDDCSNRE